MAQYFQDINFSEIYYNFFNILKKYIFSLKNILRISDVLRAIMKKIHNLCIHVWLKFFVFFKLWDFLFSTYWLCATLRCQWYDGSDNWFFFHWSSEINEIIWNFVLFTFNTCMNFLGEDELGMKCTCMELLVKSKGWRL